jgi:hydroxymethylglutaryl-CoA lyase
MRRLPQVQPMAGMPTKVSVYEVGPRDGLQNESTTLPVAVKAEFIRRLTAAGLRTIEVTSFVSPRWVPQLADADELLDALGPTAVPRMPVLVPNERGLERALAKGVRDIAIFASATESFAQRNLNRGLDAQFAMFEPVVAGARERGLRVRGYISMCFGDPWEGRVSASQVLAVGRQLLEMGCDELSLGDTIGVATPGQVDRVLSAFADDGTPLDRIAVHFHDTYGQALANTLTALRRGVTTVDSSAGGLGGCPYAESATGNLATEDLVWQLDGLGIETGVDLQALVATSGWMADRIGKTPASRVATALL